MKSLFLSIFLCISFNLFAQQKDWKSHKTAKYQIQYPSNWIFAGGDLYIDFFLIAQLESDLDTFKENISLKSHNYKGTKMTLDCFVNDSVNQIESYIKDAKIIENKLIKNGKKPYHKVIYQNSASNRNLKILKYYWMVEEKIYVLTFTAEASVYESYAEQVNQIFKNFKIL